MNMTRIFACALALDGTLANVPSYSSIFGAWKYLGNADEVKNWISAGVTASAEILAKVASGLLADSYTASGREYTMMVQPDKDLYDFKVLLAACNKHRATAKLDEDQKRRLEYLLKVLRAFLRSPTLILQAKVSKIRNNWITH